MQCIRPLLPKLAVSPAGSAIRDVPGGRGPQTSSRPYRWSRGLSRPSGLRPKNPPSQGIVGQPPIPDPKSPSGVLAGNKDEHEVDGGEDGELQAPNSNCRFSTWSVPPLAFGMMWSTVRLRSRKCFLHPAQFPPCLP